MPPETLQTLQDLEITGPAGSEPDETPYGPTENDGLPAQIGPLVPQPAPEAHPFTQPLAAYDQFYPPTLGSFEYNSASTVPIDPRLVDAQLGLPAASGPGGGFTGFHNNPWGPQSTSSVPLDNPIVSAESLPQYNPTVPLVPGMSSFEPMVRTAWSSDGSLPPAPRATTSSSLSMCDVSTPASSHSPGSPSKIGGRIAEPPPASTKASPKKLGMPFEPRAEHSSKKKRRQSSGLTSTQTKSEGASHRNNSVPSLSSKHPLAPAGMPIGTITSNDKKKQNSPSSQQTKATSSIPSQPPAPSSSKPSEPDPRARNRAAANRCRAKNKVAVAELEATERAMSTEHQELTQTARSLREEVLTLKNQLLMHGNCDDDVIQRYLANSARMVGTGVIGQSPMLPGSMSTTYPAGSFQMGLPSMPSSSSHASTAGAARASQKDRARKH
ncbi:hypothetical protein J7T55_005511 [Diaporthe amygdali]|uniref:uncharacterized protein n=1 Tax=Phomopsis amygdali TaxID=1214568 RepID=UPI0022FDDE2A|nr:uncharacterized protein J7T55_005511 [Diaporthe amygdali]KAJ0108963.1 hypothetical protein J7T55_005511 [Diaporthe amygdali]